MPTNFIFILADDLGHADLGCTGAPDAQGRVADTSSRLDRMAAEGLRFTDCYANSSVCSPTRFALISGRWQYLSMDGHEYLLNLTADARERANLAFGPAELPQATH